jgi:hypothetical protein
VKRHIVVRLCRPGFNIQEASECKYKRNIEERSRNHCYRGKAVGITYSECVSVALLSSTQSACAVLHIYCYLWPIRLYHIFPHTVLDGMIFGEKVIERKMCVLIFYTTFV